MLLRFSLKALAFVFLLSSWRLLYRSGLSFLVLSGFPFSLERQRDRKTQTDRYILRV